MGPCAFAVLCIPDLRQRMTSLGRKTYAVGVLLSVLADIALAIVIVLMIFDSSRQQNSAQYL